MNGRPPIFGTASWLLPAITAGITFFVSNAATIAGRARSEWFPGLAEALAGTGIALALAFICGLTALLRKERLRWLGLVPFLAGTAALIWVLYRLAVS